MGVIKRVVKPFTIIHHHSPDFACANLKDCVIAPAWVRSSTLPKLPSCSPVSSETKPPVPTEAWHWAQGAVAATCYPLLPRMGCAALNSVSVKLCIAVLLGASPENGIEQRRRQTAVRPSDQSHLQGSEGCSHRSSASSPLVP